MPNAAIINHKTGSLRFINGGFADVNGSREYVNDLSKHDKPKYPIIVLDTDVY